MNVNASKLSISWGNILSILKTRKVLSILWRLLPQTCLSPQLNSAITLQMKDSWIHLFWPSNGKNFAGEESSAFVWFQSCIFEENFNVLSRLSLWNIKLLVVFICSQYYYYCYIFIISLQTIYLFNSLIRTVSNTSYTNINYTQIHSN